jgi:methionine biosynthesis protein MetW
MARLPMNNLKLEYRVIADLVKEGSSVLDLGCGDGELLTILKQQRDVQKAQGIEIDEQAIFRCIKRGLSVFHGDIDSGLSEYDNKTFDYVILNQSLQQVKKPDTVLVEALRVGKNVIVGFPNFACIKARFHLAVLGKAPITKALPYEWYNTPNLHFLSIADFYEYCRKRNISIVKNVFLGDKHTLKILPNIFANSAIFLITENGVYK